MKMSTLTSQSALALLLLGASYAQAELVTVLNEAEFEDAVTRSHKPCLVKFAADWCGVCKGVKKPYEELANEPEFAYVRFIQIDIDQAKDLTTKNGVEGVPTFIFINNGTKVDEQVGVQDMANFKEQMKTKLKKHYPQNMQTSIDTEQTDQERLQEAMQEQEQRAKAEGIFNTIVAFIKWVIISIIQAVMYIVNGIKDFFNK